jgi:hypothetical protein
MYAALYFEECTHELECLFSLDVCLSLLDEGAIELLT